MSPVLPVPAIDLHAHVLTENYRAACADAGQDPPDGMPALPTWDAASALAHMDRIGIAAAVLSVSSPGVHLGDDAATVALARDVNDEVAGLVARHPGRFGLAASVPLPDVTAAVTETVRALDELAADAVSLHTHVAGVYLGDRSLDPLYAALDRRGALVLVHPTSPPCWQQLSFGRPRPMLEFVLDTTRAIVDLVLGGVLSDYPRIRWVVPHTGGALVSIADRVAAFAPMFAAPDAPDVDVLAALRRLHYDVAGVPLPRALPALAGLAPLDHIVYGSDHPFTSSDLAAQLAGALVDASRPGGALPLPLPDLAHRNAAVLVPRLARAAGLTGEN